MKVITCIVARTTSTRLPLKVLRSVSPDHTKSMLDIIIDKAKLSKLADKVFICTSSESCDDILEDVALKHQISIYRGAGDAVIERLVNVADSEKADYIVRITGDNIFVAGEFLDEQIKLSIEQDLDYCRLAGVPIGATAEVIKVSALKQLYNEMDISVSEYLMLYIFDPTRFKCGVIQSIDDFSQYGITVDTHEDLENVKRIIAILGTKADELSLENIFSLYIKKSEFFKKIPHEARIKLPYGKSTSFEVFLSEQKNRIKSSQCVKFIKISQ
ncbi:hypothetical protein J4H19_12700 [Vibrio alginolyticus]|uniref:cytidylyltransferase domain-containing protein n=1 Tax=Vibrio alginolyticus TaxID=663 RepID=UPI001BD5C338|nr:hypothetical protein [Vibrio alginolyticus]EME9802041.1 hypothetical protein [Vibrio alginolyticus]MBS9837488.1 hypothetical protein [Vibrio alginolyticus]